MFDAVSLETRYKLSLLVFLFKIYNSLVDIPNGLNKCTLFCTVRQTLFIIFDTKCTNNNMITIFI